MNNHNLVQNTPNSRERSPDAKGAQAFARFLNANQGKTYFLGMMAFLFGAILYFAISGLSEGGSPSPQSSAETGLIWVSVVGLLVVITIFYMFYRQSVNLPVREQLRYYQLGNVKPLTLEQAKALRLHIVEMYHGGFWIKTLEYYPCDIRVNNPKFKPQSFYVADRSNYKAGLNDDWGVVSKAQYENMVEELFSGMHSKLFAVDMDYTIHYKSYMRGATAEELKNIGSQNANFVNRLAGLIEKPATYVTACFEELAGKPKPLIWGFDLWRVIPMSREAFMAGYIPEEEAWKNILRASALIHYLFDSFDSFYDNVRLGNAYWSNDLKTTTKRLEMKKLYDERCDWPQRDLPWSSDLMPDISEEMRTGFASYIRSRNKSHNEVGFKLNGDGE